MRIQGYTIGYEWYQAASVYDKSMPAQAALVYDKSMPAQTEPDIQTSADKQEDSRISLELSLEGKEKAEEERLQKELAEQVHAGEEAADPAEAAVSGSSVDDTGGGYLSSDQDADAQTIAEAAEQSRQMIESNKKSMDKFNEEMKTRMICFRIAMRIMDGDVVPKKDENFLKQNASGLYSMAVQMRRYKEDPKEHGSLLSEGKGEGESNEPDAFGDPGAEMFGVPSVVAPELGVSSAVVSAPADSGGMSSTV